jgi:cysteine desulfurase/selenocysteine lyase
MIKTAHRAGVPVLVDAAQSVAHLPLDVQELDCDFLVFSGHKLYAETGIGVLYGKEQWLSRLPPYQTGGGMIEHVTFERTSYAGLPFKFEAGTPNFGGAVSLAAAIDYLQEIGFASVMQHEAGLLSYTSQKLQQISGLRIYGDTPARCGVITFNLAGAHPYDVGLLLDKQGIAVRTGTLCAEPALRHYGVTGAVRASIAMYNTSAEIDRLSDGIRKAQSLLL